MTPTQVPIPLTRGRRNYEALKPGEFCRSGRNQFVLRGLHACGHASRLDCASSRERVDLHLREIAAEACGRCGR